MKRAWVVTAGCCALGILSAVLLHWQHRFSLNPDTVSYFEMARKYAEGEWRHAVNLMWSPLYAWLLIPIMTLFGDQPLEALQAAHLLQLACVVFALWTARMLPGMSWSLLGSVLFGAVVLVPARYVTPDVLVMALSFWAVARLANELTPSYGSGRYMATGALAGWAYLAKSYFAPYFALLLVVCWAASDRSTRTKRRFVVYLAGFLLVAGPWVGVLSLTKGQVTFGEAGTVNVLSHGLIRDVDQTVGTIGRFTRVHELAFPTAMPEHYEPIPRFVGPYHLDPLRLARLLALNLSAVFFGYYPLDFPLYWPLAAILILAVGAFLSPVEPYAPANRQAMFLIGAGMAGILLFLAAHVESRYLAAFPAVFLAALACRLSAVHAEVRKPLVAMLSVLGVLFWLFPAWVFINGLRSSQAVPVDREPQTALIQWMRGYGTRYAAVGATYDLGFPAWAARTQLIASVDPEGLVGDSCQDVSAGLSRASADALLSARRYESCGVWKNIAGTGWFYWDVRRP